MKPVEIPVFRGAGDIIFRAIKIPTKSSVLPLSLNAPEIVYNPSGSPKTVLFICQVSIMNLKLSSYPQS
jgi:hypothetical protein